MGYTTDATAVDFDETNKKNREEVWKVARMLAEFKPTVIIVETLPENDAQLQESYRAYVNNPKMKFEAPSEVELLAFELGRLSGVKRIYGIDHKMEYNYQVAGQVKDKVNDQTYEKYLAMVNVAEMMANLERLPLLEKLKVNNSPRFLDLSLSFNADALTHVSTKGNYEGADEAAKFYRRNLRMYSNLNQIHFGKDDRVFILMGATHTAFFNDFMRRSPRYRLVDPFLYLK